MIFSIFLICGDRGWERIDIYICEISSVSYDMRQPHLRHLTHVHVALSSTGISMTHLFYGIFRYISSVRCKLPVTPTTNCTPPHKVKWVLQPSVPEQLPDDIRYDLPHVGQLLDHTSDLESSTTRDDLTPLPLEVPPSTCYLPKLPNSQWKYVRLCCPHFYPFINTALNLVSKMCDLHWSHTCYL